MPSQLMDVASQPLTTVLWAAGSPLPTNEAPKGGRRRAGAPWALANSRSFYPRAHAPPSVPPARAGLATREVGFIDSRPGTGSGPTVPQFQNVGAFSISDGELGLEGRFQSCQVVRGEARTGAHQGCPQPWISCGASEQCVTQPGGAHRPWGRSREPVGWVLGKCRGALGG